MALQKRQGVVAQELCRLALCGETPVNVSALAAAAGVSVAVASSAAGALARHGFISKSRRGNTVQLAVDDLGALAGLLADRTGWRHAKVAWGFGYGRSTLDVAHRITRSSQASDLRAAVTGRAGASFLGVIGTGGDRIVRARVEGDSDDAPVLMERLGLEPVDREEANVAVAFDRWALGTTHAQLQHFQSYSAMVAPSIRVWCDLDGEPRGTDFAAQLWEMMRHAS